MSFQRAIAMWSGPRNISTAMMYSFAQRPDCCVWDEPFYAWYLKNTGIQHPMGSEIIANGMTDAAAIIERCLNGDENGPPLFYQKHMCQHMIEGLDRSWINGVTNVFLVRSPIGVLASYAKKREEVGLADIGFVQQAELFDMVCDRSGVAPTVIDCDSFLADPAGQLEALCGALQIRFDETMLSWAKGPKPYDGVWAPHWYDAVWNSTGFGKTSDKPPELRAEHQGVAEKAFVHYERLRRHAI